MIVDPSEELDDRALVAAFEALAIAPAGFRHREHVRLAYAMLAGADFGEAAVRYRRALQRFARAAGAAARYHETLTWAYLAIVHRRMHEALPDRDGSPLRGDPPGGAGSLAFLARHPDLLDHLGGALARHYDVAAITACPVARRVLVLPGRAP